MLIKKFLFTCFIAIVFADANACTRTINEGCEKTIQFTMDDNITVSNVIHWEIMPGKYVLNFRHYRASDSEGVVHRLTENQLINAIKYSIAQIDKNKLYAIQLNWSSSETSRRSVEKALKENTLLGGRYSAFDKKIQKIITKSFIQSPFIRKLCMQIDNLKMSCNFKSYFLEPILFKTGEYSSGKTIRSDENANINWIGLASCQSDRRLRHRWLITR